MASRFTAGAAYAMLCVIWGSTWLAIRIGLTGAPPLLAATLRFALAIAVLLPIIVWRRSPMPKGRTEWALVGFVGLVLYAFDYGLIYWGEANGVESGLSAILFSTFVLQTALFAQVLLGSEKLTVQKLAGFGLGFAGILLIFRNELGTAGLGKLFPMVAIVLSATCASLASVATKRWGHDTDPISFTALSMAVGVAGLAVASATAGEPWSAPAWPEGVLTIVYLGLAGSVVAFVTYWWILKRIEATSASYIGMITPLVAVSLGFTVGGEALDPLALAGAGMTLAGIFVAVNRRWGAWARGGGAATERRPAR